MPLNNAAKAVMLDALAGVAVFASLHSADPGSTGASELTGGSPAYARKSVTYAASSAGAKAINNTPAFDVPAGSTVAFCGLWSAATGGTFYGGYDVTDETFTGQGTYTLAALTNTLT